MDVEKLKQLKQLLDSGVLTQQEFDTEKAKILENETKEDTATVSNEDHKTVECQTTPPPIIQSEITKTKSSESSSQERPKKSYVLKGFKIVVGMFLGLIVLVFLLRLALRHTDIRIDNHITGEAAVIIENDSNNPYEIWVDGNSQGIIEGYGKIEVRTDNKTMIIRALQQSGYALYPTENIRNFVNLERTHTYRCNIGNMKKNKTISKCECHGR